MRPYLAIIKDSFRRAIASRVLYIMLVLITGFLLLLAPIGYKEQLTTRVFVTDFSAPVKFMQRIAEKGPADAASPEGRVWTRLDASTQRKLEELIKSEEDAKDDDKRALDSLVSFNAFVAALERIINELDFFDRAMWEDLRRNDEAEQLLTLDDQELSDEQKQRLNRLWLEAAFDGNVNAGSRTSIRFYYGPMDIGRAFPISQQELEKIVYTGLPYVLDTYVLSVGLLVAVLVTAPIIPQTFEPGALSLQLSKPISRWLLFLSKFIGGCAFALLCVTYLFGGMWLLLGVRMGIWHHGIWLCIPIYVFVFMIYYSVTAISGVVWRNTIVAVMMTILFWFTCFLVDTVKGFWEGSLKQEQLTKLVPVEDDVIAVNQTSVAHRWDSSTGEWDEILLTDEQKHRVSFLGIQQPLPPMIGPVYSQQFDEIVAVRTEMFAGQKIIGGRRETDYRLLEGPNPPGRTFKLLAEPTGKIIAVTSGGALFRIDADPFAVPPPNVKEDDAQPRQVALPRIAIAPPLAVATPSDFAINPDSGVLAAYSQGHVTLLKPDDDGAYERVLEKEVDIDAETAVAIAFAGETLLVASADGDVSVFDGATLELRQSLQPAGIATPRHVAASPGGRWFAINYHNGELWLLDTTNGEVKEANVADTGGVSGVSFSGPNAMLVCDRTTRVTQYDLETGKVTAEFAPSLTFGDHMYYKFIVPFYTVFPKPRGFYMTVQYLLLEEDAVGFGGRLNDPHQELHPWRPVWSGLAFIVVMLGLACIYIERQEY